MNPRKNNAPKLQDVPFSMYDAFTDIPYSGSQAAVVLNASPIILKHRSRIAREIGTPATAFVNEITGNRIKVQFFSTVMELPMCGHGTVCLITKLVDYGLLSCAGRNWHVAILELPKGAAKVEYRKIKDGRCEVMLDVSTATFNPANLDLAALAKILNIDTNDISEEFSPEIATGNFTHLCLPLRDLSAMGRLHPDFDTLRKFCISNRIETVAAFSTEVVNTEKNIHVRDFCPAVGVAESAAAGTTNAALSTYLWRHNCLRADDDGCIIVHAEQGIELGRPSQVTTRIKIKNEQIIRLQVGGIATRIIEGTLNVEMGPP